MKALRFFLGEKSYDSLWLCATFFISSFYYYFFFFYLINSREHIFKYADLKFLSSALPMISKHKTSSPFKSNSGYGVLYNSNNCSHIFSFFDNTENMTLLPHTDTFIVLQAKVTKIIFWVRNSPECDDML